MHTACAVSIAIVCTLKHVNTSGHNITIQTRAEKVSCGCTCHYHGYCTCIFSKSRHGRWLLFSLGATCRARLRGAPEHTWTTGVKLVRTIWGEKQVDLAGWTDFGGEALKLSGRCCWDSKTWTSSSDDPELLSVIPHWDPDSIKSSFRFSACDSTLIPESSSSELCRSNSIELPGSVSKPQLSRLSCRGKFCLEVFMLRAFVKERGWNGTAERSTNAPARRVFWEGVGLDSDLSACVWGDVELLPKMKTG